MLQPNPHGIWSPQGKVISRTWFQWKVENPAVSSGECSFQMGSIRGLTPRAQTPPQEHCWISAEFTDKLRCAGSHFLPEWASGSWRCWVSPWPRAMIRPGRKHEWSRVVLEGGALTASPALLDCSFQLLELYSTALPVWSYLHGPPSPTSFPLGPCSHHSADPSPSSQSLCSTHCPGRKSPRPSGPGPRLTLCQHPLPASHSLSQSAIKQPVCKCRAAMIYCLSETQINLICIDLSTRCTFSLTFNMCICIVIYSNATVTKYLLLTVQHPLSGDSWPASPDPNLCGKENIKVMISHHPWIFPWIIHRWQYGDGD